MNLLSTFEAIIGFSLLVFVHELGHFLAGKLIKVRIDVFSFGFGPSLKKKWGETEYRLSLVPLGGYVKLAGEEPKPGETAKPDEFYGKTVGQRSFVFAAGVIMNAIFGFVIFFAAYQIGVPVIPAEVGAVIPGGSAWKAGLERGDRIERIAGVSPPIDFEDLTTTVILAGRGEGVKLLLRRDGRAFERVLYPEYRSEIGMPTVGIVAPHPPVVGMRPEQRKRRKLSDPDPLLAYEAGLREGDVVTAVKVAGQADPIPLHDQEDFAYAMQQCAGRPVQVLFDRAGAPHEPISVMPQFLGEARWLGIGFASNCVSAVRPDAWPDKLGIQPGDAIVSVAGKPTLSRGQVVEALDKAAGQAVPLEVKRMDAALALTAPADRGGLKAADALAFEPQLVVDTLLPGYPAAKLGLRQGDVVTGAAGLPVKDHAELTDVLIQMAGKPVLVAWTRAGKESSGLAIPARMWIVDVPWRLEKRIVKAGLVQSSILGARKARQWTIRVYGTLRGLVLGQLSTRHLSGPLSIAYISYEAARQSMGTLFYILGVLSMNLAVVNLLPIPVLDGGHLLFAVIEKVRRKSVSERVRSGATYVGLSLLIALFVLTFWNDIRTFLLPLFD